MSKASGSRGTMPPAADVLLFLAPALGPTVGGHLLHVGAWPLIFLINVTFGALGPRCRSHVVAPSPIRARDPHRGINCSGDVHDALSHPDLLETFFQQREGARVADVLASFHLPASALKGNGSQATTLPLAARQALTQAVINGAA